MSATIRWGIPAVVACASLLAAGNPAKADHNYRYGSSYSYSVARPSCSTPVVVQPSCGVSYSRSYPVYSTRSYPVYSSSYCSTPAYYSSPVVYSRPVTYYSSPVIYRTPSVRYYPSVVRYSTPVRHYYPSHHSGFSFGFSYHKR